MYKRREMEIFFQNSGKIKTIGYEGPVVFLIINEIYIYNIKFILR